MPIKIQDRTKCSGCYACVSTCPKHCISMKEDVEGFWYPLVDTSRCVNCELCNKICPILNQIPVNKEFETVSYAAINKHENDRMNSSSGGVFCAIAELVITEGGVVFGASFSDDFSVRTEFVETKNKLFKLQGSKYVQSKIGDSFDRAKSFLDEGRLVFFTGTPCQIGGLRAFLMKDYDNLLTADLVCHGVPSPLVWKKYIDFRKKAAQSDIAKASFRYKNCGWKKYSVLFEFTNNTDYLQEHNKDPFMKTFLGDYCLRPSCYECVYKTEKRDADITLADFWGIESVCPEMDDDKGTSLVIIHSSKGKKFFDSISEKLIINDFSIQDIQSYNSAYLKPANKPKERIDFLKSIEINDFSTAYNQLQRAIKKNDLCLQIVNDFKKKRLRRVMRSMKKLATKSY